MVSLGALWLPIVVSAVLVFLGGWILHMFLPYHKSDFSRIPNEDAFLAANSGLSPGNYSFPHATGGEAFKDPAYKAKCDQGPVGIMNVGPNGLPNMGKMLGTHFVFCLVGSLLAAYVAGITIPAGADYLLVFRVTGAVAFIAYSFAAIQASIWYWQKWSTTWKTVADGLIYGLLTAGVFGWLWPA